MGFYIRKKKQNLLKSSYSIYNFFNQNIKFLYSEKSTAQIQPKISNSICQIYESHNQICQSQSLDPSQPFLIATFIPRIRKELTLLHKKISQWPKTDSFFFFFLKQSKSWLSCGFQLAQLLMVE